MTLMTDLLMSSIKNLGAAYNKLDEARPGLDSKTVEILEEIMKSVGDLSLASSMMLISLLELADRQLRATPAAAPSSAPEPSLPPDPSAN